MVREKYFVLGRLEQPRQYKNLLYWHDESNEPNKEGPFHMYYLTPLLPQFQQSAGATHLKSLCFEPKKITSAER